MHYEDNTDDDDDEENEKNEGDNFASDTHDELVADRNVKLSVT